MGKQLRGDEGARVKDQTEASSQARDSKTLGQTSASVRPPPLLRSPQALFIRCLTLTIHCSHSHPLDGARRKAEAGVFFCVSFCGGPLRFVLLCVGPYLLFVYCTCVNQYLHCGVRFVHSTSPEGQEKKSKTQIGFVEIQVCESHWTSF